MNDPNTLLSIESNARFKSWEVTLMKTKSESKLDKNLCKHNNEIFQTFE